MRFYLKDFCIFISVAETGSLSKTAEIMGLSISSVSKRLSRLEEYLQTTLFERNTRGVRLSPLGTQAYIKSKDMTNVFSTFIDELRDAKRLGFNVQVDKSISLFPLVDWLYDYAATSVNVSVSYKNGAGYRSQPLSMSDIIISPVKSTWPLAIHRRLPPISRGFYTRAGAQSFTEASLETENIILYSEEINEIPEVTKGTSGAKRVLHPSLTTDDAADVLRFILDKGIIAGGIPDYLIRPALNAGLVKRILPEWSFRNIQHYLIWKDRRYYNEEFSKFIEFIELRFKSFLS